MQKECRMTYFDKLTQDCDTLADGVAKLIVHHVRNTIESNYGTTGNDVMWEKYLKEHRKAMQDFLNKEVSDEVV